MAYKIIIVVNDRINLHFVHTLHDNVSIIIYIGVLILTFLLVFIIIIIIQNLIIVEWRWKHFCRSINATRDQLFPLSVIEYTVYHIIIGASFCNKSSRCDVSDIHVPVIPTTADIAIILHKNYFFKHSANILPTSKLPYVFTFTHYYRNECPTTALQSWNVNIWLLRWWRCQRTRVAWKRSNKWYFVHAVWLCRLSKNVVDFFFWLTQK